MGYISFFFNFDCSAIKTITSANLYITGATTTSGRIIAVASEHGSSISTADFDAIKGWNPSSGADQSGNVTQYSSIISSWVTGKNTITLNATALTKLVDLDEFEVCLMNYDYDLLGVDPGTSSTTTNGVSYNDHADSADRPYIDVIYPSPSTSDAIFFGHNF